MGCGRSVSPLPGALDACDDSLSPTWPSLGQLCLDDALRRLDAAYAGDATQVYDSADGAGRLAVDVSNADVGSNVYGEVLPASFAAAVARLGAHPAMRFYDLGCGSGKLVNLAAMLGFIATGIELEDSRYEMACAAHARLHSKVSCAPPRFIHASFLHHDFSDADIIFINSVGFGAGMIRSLALNARKMRGGSQIISFRPLPGPEFKELEVVPMVVSWQGNGDAALFHVQEVIKITSNEAMLTL